MCDSIAWLAGRGDFARGSVMKHHHDSIVAIGNTPKPNVEETTKPLLPTSPQIATRRGRGARNRRLIVLIETGGSRHRHFDAGPPGLKSAGGTPWFNSRRAWRRNLQRRLHTGRTPVPRSRSRKRLSAYPHHQPRRGGIISAGAARPRDSKEPPSYPHRWLSPPAPELSAVRA